MKIFALMLVKDEIDVIDAVIDHARGWADRIVVLDTGSTDGTWERLQAMDDGQVVAWMQTAEPYHDSQRADMMAHFRHEAAPGDWWCKLDADEFFHDDPRQFLAAVPRPYHCVFKRSIDYVLTPADVETLPFDLGFAAVRPRMHHILPVCHTEFRFFRHRHALRWARPAWAPHNKGPKYPDPITVKHYQFRSPEQIQHRLDVRNALPRGDGRELFKHIRETHWREVLYDPRDVIDDTDVSDLRTLPLAGPRKQSPWRRIAKAGGGRAQLLAYRLGVLR